MKEMLIVFGCLIAGGLIVALWGRVMDKVDEFTDQFYNPS